MNKNFPTLFLPVEVKVRDFEARLFVAAKAAALGYNCILGNKTAVNQAAGNLPGMYVCKGVTINELGFYQRIKDIGGMILRLDEEGGIYLEDASMDYELRFPAELLRLMDRVLLWGQEQYDVFTSEPYAALSAGKLAVTGHPRFDLRKPEFGGYYRSLRSRKVRSPYILINSTFGHGNPKTGFDFELKQFSGFDESDQAHALEYYRYGQRMLLDFIAMTNAVAERFPGVTFVYRPHPHEDIAFYDDKFLKNRNVVVSLEGSVQEWIVDAECVLHQDCTTAIEAFLFGKPVYSYLPSRDAYMQQLPPLVSIICDSVPKLIRQIESLLAGDAAAVDSAEQRADKMRLIKHVIDNTDHWAVDAIMDVLRAMPQAPPIRDAGEIKAVVRESFPRRIKEGLRRVREALGLRRIPPSELLYRQKYPGVTKGEITTRLRLLAELDPALAGIAVQRISRTCFLLHGKG